MKLKLSILKDLGLRPIELTWLTIKDIDLSTGIASITGAKHTVGRNGKLKSRTLEMLKKYSLRKLIYFTIRTGHAACLTTPWLTLPNKISFILLKPLAPITIKSNFPSLQRSIITLTVCPLSSKVST